MNNPMYNQGPGSGAPPPVQPRPGVGQMPPGMAPPGMMPPQQQQKPPEEEAPKGPPQSLEDIHIDELLHQVVDVNASDLHLCTASPPVLRVDGKLKRMHYESFTPMLSQRVLFEILSDEN